jgi:hypothetical protein
MKVSIFLVSVLFTFTAHAINMSGCDNLMNDGWYKKYKYQGIDQPLTKATKDHGSSAGSSRATTERSTATLDPKYSSNVTTSQTNFTSSRGPCGAIAMNEIRETRDLYIAQNRDEMLKEIAVGHGEHLNALASFSFCDKTSYGHFAAQMQAHAADFINSQTSASFASVIDREVSQDTDLSKSCYVYGI